MKIFDLRPGDGGWEGDYWKASPFQAGSSCIKVIQDEQSPLREKDIGQVFIRCFPRQLPGREEHDFSFLPISPLEEDCENVALKLEAVDREGELHFSGAWEMVLKKDWNDGHWMKLRDYLKAINCLEEKPIPPRNFYQGGAKKRRRL